MQINQKGVYISNIDDAICKKCGICARICPGKGLDFGHLNDQLFGRQPNNFRVGNYIRTFIGNAERQEIRFGSSSGGLVTALLSFALESGIIDGALVTRMMNDAPLFPEPFLARTPEDVLSAIGSKYCPVASNTALVDIVNRKGRYAFVGLPCHIHGVRLAEEQDARLRERIVLHLGLFCAKTISFRGTERLLQRMGIYPEQVRYISYRGRGWPGNLFLALKDTSVIEVPLKEYYDMFFGSFSPWRCLFCPDHTSELADLSFGDAWLDTYAKDDQGKSVVVARTGSGQDFLDRALKSKIVRLEPVKVDSIMQSQQNFRWKKDLLSARIGLVRRLGIKVPDFDGCFLPIPSAKSYVASLFHLLRRLVLQHVPPLHF